MPNVTSSQSLHCCQFLHIRSPTCSIFAPHFVPLGGPCRFVHAHSGGVLTAPSLCACGCIRHTEPRSEAFSNPGENQEFVRLPIPLTCGFLLDVVTRKAVLRRAVRSDRAATHRRHCDSTLFWASLMCKQSD
jgi:hypothetical protein